MCTLKMRALSYIGAEKITFPPKPDGQTDIQTDRRTDISNYRVASLLKRVKTWMDKLTKRVAEHIALGNLHNKNQLSILKYSTLNVVTNIKTDN